MFETYVEVILAFSIEDDERLAVREDPVDLGEVEVGGDELEAEVLDGLDVGWGLAELEEGEALRDGEGGGDEEGGQRRPVTLATRWANEQNSEDDGLNREADEESVVSVDVEMTPLEQHARLRPPARSTGVGR